MATVEILCRFDAGKQAPVVFLRDTIQGDKIQVWDREGQRTMPLDYYRMTAPLSADDERVLMEQFKKATNRQDQMVHINHRMPRTSRPMPNLLAPAAGKNQMKDINPPPAPAKSAAKSTGAKPIDAQPAPSGPSGDLPRPGETPAQAPAATTTAPATALVPPANPNEPPSAGMFRRIQELNQHSVELNQKIAALDEEKQKATTDLNATKAAIKELMAEFEAALEAEAAEETRKRREMLAQLAGTLDPVTQFAQELAAAGAQPAGKAQETAQEAKTQPSKAQAPAKNGNASKPPAKAATKPASKTAASKAPASRKK